MSFNTVTLRRHCGWWTVFEWWGMVKGGQLHHACISLYISWCYSSVMKLVNHVHGELVSIASVVLVTMTSLSVPHNIVMDLNNVMTFLWSLYNNIHFTLFYCSLPWVQLGVTRCQSDVFSRSWEESKQNLGVLAPNMNMSPFSSYWSLPLKGIMFTWLKN